MRKRFLYRIFPTKKQTTKLNETLEECRWLYIHLLARRQTTYELTGKGLSCYGQQAMYPLLKQARPSLTTVHSQVLQNVAVRVDLAFQAFFRRCKAGETPGFPRFRGRDRYDSFTDPQSGFHIDAQGKLSASGIGPVKIVLHRAMRGTLNFGVICGEDLTVNRMLHTHCLAKSIADASWSAFFNQLDAKAEEAGRTLIKVNPAYTSQTCSQCGHRQKMPLSQRIFACPCYHVHLERDLNAALNIRAVGLHSLGLSLEARA
jgi:IS605 OrfB family transposase